MFVGNVFGAACAPDYQRVAHDPVIADQNRLRVNVKTIAARGARLAVLVLSTQPESLRTYRFCREQGIPAVLFDVPPDMRLADEGHFGAAGNAAVAALAGRLAAEPETPRAAGTLE